MSRFGIQQLSVNGTYFAGCSGESMDRAVDVNTDQQDGVTQETAQHIMARKPTGEFTTLNLKVVLAAMGTSGTNIFPIIILDGSSGAVMVGGKTATGGGYATGSVHAARTALNGLIYLASLRWSPMQKAVFALKGMFTSTDGVTDPVVPSTVSLPTQSDPNNGWTLFALTVNGVSIVTVNSLELTIDPKLDFEFNTGLPMPIDISGAGMRGALAIRLRADIGDATLADGTGTVVMVFKPYANGGGFSGSTSLTITLHGNYAFETGFGGQAASPMGKQLTVIPTFDGTNNAMTWAET